MGINIHEFKAVAEAYDFIAKQLNSGMPMGDKQLQGFIVSGKEIGKALATGTMPGWLKYKMIKLNILPHLDNAEAWSQRTGWEDYGI